MREPLAPHADIAPATGERATCLPLSVLANLLQNPQRAAAGALALARQLGRIAAGEQPLSRPADARFSDPQWQQHPLRSRALQAWLATGREIDRWIVDMPLQEQDRQRLHLIAEHLGDALAPSNGPLHPRFLPRLRESAGASLVDGLRNLRNDLLHNGGLPRHVAADAFEVGQDLAATPGSVIFRNEMLELIQYQPRTAEQHQRPLLIVPPQINRFYIFDLGEQRSFVRHALDGGVAVFIVSWRNPDPQHRHWGFSDYVHALTEAVDACLAISRSESLNLLGACLGGLSCALLLNELARQDRRRQVASCTYLVTPLDGRGDHPALLFLDARTRERARLQSLRQGVLHAHQLARLFAWLRPRDLVWRYWTQSYLLGESPPAFDILYWNADGTRLPAQLHGEILDLLAHESAAPHLPAQEPPGPGDFSHLDIDCFAVAGSSDHITPWRSVYRSMHRLAGNCPFVLASSGHIQAILSPPDTPGAHYFAAPTSEADAEQWQRSAQRMDGSWWPRWLGWLQARSGARQPSPIEPGSPQHPPLAQAPGSYVRQA